MKPNCKGNLVAENACGECPKCIDEAKGYVKKFFFIPLDEMSVNAAIVFSMAQAVVLANLTPDEIKDFIASLKQDRGGSHEATPDR